MSSAISPCVFLPFCPCSLPRGRMRKRSGCVNHTNTSTPSSGFNSIWKLMGRSFISSHSGLRIRGSGFMHGKGHYWKTCHAIRPFCLKSELVLRRNSSCALGGESNGDKSSLLVWRGQDMLRIKYVAASWFQCLLQTALSPKKAFILISQSPATSSALILFRAFIP